MKPELRDRLGEIDFFADVGALGLLELRHNGKAIAEDERLALLQRLHTGEHVEIEFDAETYLQGDAPNRKFVRFKPGILKKLARSFSGMPFLRDHEKNKLKARGGTILASELVEGPKGTAFRQTVKLVKPWAVEGVLDGTIDRFSIGAHPTGDVVCTVHKTPIFSKCFCLPGDKVSLKDGGEEHIVEFEFTAADGVEVSAVNVPAVVGTGIKGIRAALSALAADTGGIVPPPQEEGTSMKRLLVLLGLNEAATEDAAVSAFEVMKVELETSRERLKVVEPRLREVEGELGAARTERLDRTIEQLHAEGKLPIVRNEKGERISSKLELALRSMADKAGFDAMKEYAASLPVVAPIGPRALEAALGGGTPPASAAAATGDAVSQYAVANNISPDTLATVMAQAGVTPEMLAASGPRRQKGA